jgi:hypothetical protein
MFCTIDLLASCRTNLEVERKKKQLKKSLLPDNAKIFLQKKSKRSQKTAGINVFVTIFA